MMSRSVVPSPLRLGGRGIDQSANKGFLRPSALPVTVAMVFLLGDPGEKLRDLARFSFRQSQTEDIQVYLARVVEGFQPRLLPNRIGCRLWRCHRPHRTRPAVDLPLPL